MSSKNSWLWSVIMSYSRNREPFLNWIVMCDEKCILYNNQWWTVQWLDWEEAPKHLPKSNLNHKRSLSLFGGMLPFSATKAFWILVKPLHLRSMLSKLMRCTENYLRLALINTKNQFFSMTMPDHTSHRTNASKIEWIGLWSFASTTIFTWPPANHLPFLQASQQYFARKKLPKPVEGRKCFPKIHQIPKHGFLCYRNKETYFLLQKYVDYNGSYFD